MNSNNRLVVGISGASGVIYGIRLLQILKDLPVETHLVISRSAEITVAHETSWKISDIGSLADYKYKQDDIGAAISSGSFKTLGMVIAPCSIRTASEIATGVTSTLLTRAADVALKERRRLVLMIRETPLHLGHLRTLSTLSEIGAVIAPPVPAFYAKPTSLNDMIGHSLGRVMDMFDIETGTAHRWKDTNAESKA